MRSKSKYHLRFPWNAIEAVMAWQARNRAKRDTAEAEGLLLSLEIVGALFHLLER